MKPAQLKSEPSIEPSVEPFSKLKLLIATAMAENDAGLLRAESSQAPFNSTRLLLTGRREVLDAIKLYLDGDSSRLEALAQP